MKKRKIKQLKRNVKNNSKKIYIYFLCAIIAIILIILIIKILPKKKELKCATGEYYYNNSCVKPVDVKQSISENSCDEGFTISDDYQKCTKLETIEAKIDNPCPSDYTYNDYKCTKTETKEVSIVASCSGSNGTLNADKTKCTYKDTRTPNINYICSSSYALWRGEELGCRQKVDKENCIYYESKGYVFSKDYSTCYGPKHDVRKEYTCITGYTLEGTTCVRTYELTALQTKTCPSGYSSSGNQCVKTTIIDVQGNYYCDEGYTLDNHTCSKTIIKESNKKYSCEDNSYILYEDECVKFD